MMRWGMLLSYSMNSKALHNDEKNKKNTRKENIIYFVE